MRRLRLWLCLAVLVAGTAVLAQTTIFSDTFTDTNGVDLGVHTPTSGTSWTRNDTSNAESLEIQSNKVQQINNFTGGRYYQTPDPSTGNYSVTVTISNTVTSGWGGHMAGVFARATPIGGGSIGFTTAYECYWAEVDSTGGGNGEWRLAEWVGGTEQTPLDTEPDAFTTGQSRTVTLTVNGSALSCDISNGATKNLTATDASLSAAGKAGMGIMGGVFQGLQVDTYNSSTLAGPAATPTRMLLQGIGAHP